ncbi:MAG: SCO family protein, partial [Alphaproteobacteria bacterium]|nr:SCO family protein [Alphaproteobacteria bacterium]
MKGVWLALGLALAAGAASGQHASSSLLLDEKKAMAYSQDAIGRHVGDASFVDSDGKARRLADFAGKPVLVSLIYTSCH